MTYRWYRTRFATLTPAEAVASPPRPASRGDRHIVPKLTNPGSPFEGYPVVISLPVQWGDQDAFLHVNNTVYFRWFESARIAYGERVGLFGLMKAERIGPILASITCQYRLPITYPDEVMIGARITRIGRTSMTMEHCLLSEAAGAVAADGSSVMVLYDYKTERPHPVPENIREAIEGLEGRPVDETPPDPAQGG